LIKSLHIASYNAAWVQILARTLQTFPQCSHAWRSEGHSASYTRVFLVFLAAMVEKGVREWDWPTHLTSCRRSTICRALPPYLSCVAHDACGSDRDTFPYRLGR